MNHRLFDQRHEHKEMLALMLQLEELEIQKNKDATY